MDALLRPVCPWPSQLVTGLQQCPLRPSPHRVCRTPSRKSQRCGLHPSIRVRVHEGQPPTLPNLPPEEQEPEDPAGWDVDKEASRIWRRTVRFPAVAVSTYQVLGTVADPCDCFICSITHTKTGRSIGVRIAMYDILAPSGSKF